MIKICDKMEQRAKTFRTGSQSAKSDQRFWLSAAEEPQLPLVVSSPHSGRQYFPKFRQLSCLDSLTLRYSEDAFVDHLVAAAPKLGAALIAAMAPRAFVDLNRSEHDLDPALIKGMRGRSTNPRVAAGFGVVPRVVTQQHPIYSARLPRSVVEQRLQQWYWPYHQRLAALLASAQQKFGWVLLLDCHSMPSDVGSPIGKIPLADIVLGDRYGKTATPTILKAVHQAFASQGFSVARNTPFAGGHITEHYGNPLNNIFAIQVEINRGLYLDERLIQPKPGFVHIQNHIAQALSQISHFVKLHSKL